MSKNETLGRVAGLLNKFQGRLDSLRNDFTSIKRRQSATDDQVAILADNLRLTAEKSADAHRMATDALLDHETQKGVNKLHGQKFEDLRVALNKTSALALELKEKVNAEKNDYDFRESQIKINKEVSDSLYALRDSVQKSFDSVRSDMEKVLKQLQHANARVGEAESNNLALHASLKLFEQRLTVTETNSKIARDVFALLKNLFKEESK